MLLTSCNFSPVNRIADYQNPGAELIKTLLTEQDLSEIASEFHWQDIILTQNQNIADSESSTHYEEAQSSYFGNFQNSDNSVMIFHTVDKYASPIDKDKPIKFLLGGITSNGEVTSYIPDISASGDVAAKCLMEVETFKQICDVQVKYEYIQTDINITTRNIDREIASKWINAIISIVEPRILSQDTGQ
jgi:hypothetical protein